MYLKKWRSENKDRVKESRRRWAKAHPEVGKAKVYKWRAKFPEKFRAYMKRWHANNPFRKMMHDLKYLSKHPDCSMFPYFSSLDRCPGFEQNILVNRITPLDELIMKEEGLL